MKNTCAIKSPAKGPRSRIIAAIGIPFPANPGLSEFEVTPDEIKIHAIRQEASPEGDKS